MNLKKLEKIADRFYEKYCHRWVNTVSNTPGICAVGIVVNKIGNTDMGICVTVYKDENLLHALPNTFENVTVHKKLVNSLPKAL